MECNLEKKHKVNHKKIPHINIIHVFYIFLIYHRILPYIEHNLTTLFKFFSDSCCIFGFYISISGTLLRQYV